MEFGNICPLLDRLAARRTPSASAASGQGRRTVCLRVRAVSAGGLGTVAAWASPPACATICPDLWGVLLNGAGHRAAAGGGSGPRRRGAHAAGEVRRRTLPGHVAAARGARTGRPHQGGHLVGLGSPRGVRATAGDDPVGADRRVARPGRRTRSAGRADLGRGPVRIRNVHPDRRGSAPAGLAADRRPGLWDRRAAASGPAASRPVLPGRGLRRRLPARTAGPLAAAPDGACPSRRDSGTPVAGRPGGSAGRHRQRRDAAGPAVRDRPAPGRADPAGAEGAHRCRGRLRLAGGGGAAGATAGAAVVVECAGGAGGGAGAVRREHPRGGRGVPRVGGRTGTGATRRGHARAGGEHGAGRAGRRRDRRARRPVPAPGPAPDAGRGAGGRAAGHTVPGEPAERRSGDSSRA